jgi:hypothetical protein
MDLILIADVQWKVTEIWQAALKLFLLANHNYFKFKKISEKW